MQATSQTWRDMAASPTARLRTRAIIGGATYTDMAPPVVRRALMGEDAISVGNCVAASVTLELATENSAGENIPRSAEVKLEMWWEEADGTVSEALPVGTFYVARRRYATRAGRMALECYDALLRAEAPISAAGIAAWPAAEEDVVSAIAAALGVEADDRNRYFSASRTIDEPGAGATLRDVLSGIAAVNGGNWVITPAGRLRLKWICHQGPTDYVEYPPGDDRCTSDLVRMDGVVGAADYDVIPFGEGGDRFRLTGVRWRDGAGGETLIGSAAGAVVPMEAALADEAAARRLYRMCYGDYWWPSAFEGAIYDPAAELGDWLVFWIHFERNGVPTMTEGHCMLCAETVTLGPAPRAAVTMPEPGEAADEYPYIGGVGRQAMALAEQGRRLEAAEAAIGALEALGDPVALEHGGTGADTAPGALDNLGIKYTTVTGTTNANGNIALGLDSRRYSVISVKSTATNYVALPYANTGGAYLWQAHVRDNYVAHSVVANTAVTLLVTYIDFGAGALA